MKKILLAAICLIVFYAFTARAQIVEGRYDVYAGPMNRVAEEHTNYYAGVSIPGVAEDAKSQDQRYNEMTKPLNDAGVRHYDNAISDTAGSVKEPTNRDIATSVPDPFNSELP